MLIDLVLDRMEDDCEIVERAHWPFDPDASPASRATLGRGFSQSERLARGPFEAGLVSPRRLHDQPEPTELAGRELLEETFSRTVETHPDRPLLAGRDLEGRFPEDDST